MMNRASLFEPFTFANGATLSNKIVMAPMTTWSGDNQGNNTEEELRYYAARSAGVGMVITGTTYSIAGGKGFDGQFSAEDDRYIPSLKKLAQTIQSQGAKAVLQIFHAGRLSRPEWVPDGDVVAPSSVRAVRADEDSRPPRALSESEIHKIIQSFAAATSRAIAAGFDGVEIHGANGYLIQQFFSPHANQRTDSWGGSRPARARFALSVLDAVHNVVREQAPKTFILGYRFSPEETGEVGITLDDTCYLIDQLLERPLTYLHVSLKQFDLTSQRDAADKRVIGDLVRRQINGRVPLIGVGGIKTADDLIKAKAIGYDLIAVGSALIADPQWVEKIKSGKPCLPWVTEEHVLKYHVPQTMFETLKLYFPNVIG
ncbi:MAG: NADH-dependent flavin oxidoreductase [Burkholderiales bacterium]|jgi:2,4-dienoyl-CoA reductase-like NADH-dependent reductase (Old Yellow Enzyme family)|nr:NADH-dependent flavin oxidoreductase [Burkholderiales bacterium]